MKIKFYEQEIELKYCFKAYMLYEKIENKSFQPKGLYDIIVFFYCVCMASDKNFNTTFDDFLEYLDQYPNLVTEFSGWLTAILTKNDITKPEEEDNKKTNNNESKKG